MGRPADLEKRTARDQAARDGLARGEKPVQIACDPAFAGLSFASAATEAYAAVRRVTAVETLVVEAVAVTVTVTPPPPRPPWGLPELLAYLTQLADVTSDLAGAADFAGLAAVLDPYLAARARDAGRALAVELDRRRDFELRLSERIFLAHEVLQRRAEKR